MIYIPCWTTDCKYQGAERMSCNEAKHCCIKDGKCVGFTLKPKEIEKIIVYAMEDNFDSGKIKLKLNELIEVVNELKSRVDQVI